MALNARLEAAGIDNIVAIATDPGLTCTGVNIQHNLGHSLLGVFDGWIPTAFIHDVAGHHAADGSVVPLQFVDYRTSVNIAHPTRHFLSHTLLELVQSCDCCLTHTVDIKARAMSVKRSGGQCGDTFWPPRTLCHTLPRVLTNTRHLARVPFFLGHS